MAVLFAIAAVPVTIMFGAGIELGNISHKQIELQSALDAAVVDNATYGRGINDEAIKYAKNFVRSSLGEDITLEELYIGKEKKNNADVITLTSTSSVKPIVGTVMGYNKFQLRAESSATASMGKNEIVFALDNTASMASHNRMTNLKAAVKKVLGQLQEQQNGDNVKVAIVPFNTMVRIDPGTNYDYINYGTATTSYGCNSSAGPNSWPGCTLGWRQIDAICKDIEDRASCNGNALIYEIPTVWNGYENTYYQTVKSYVKTGSTYKIMTISSRYRQVGSTCSGYITDETGTRCNAWSGGYEILDNEVINIYSDQSSLNLYNAVPDAPYKKMPNYLVWTYSTGNGFGASSTESKYYYTAYNSTRRQAWTTPAIEQKTLWKGCIYDRDQNYDTTADAAKPSNIKTLYYALNCDNTVETVLGLTTDFTTLNKKVDNLVSSGYTNITIGLQFAMEVLSPTAPFIEGANFSDLSTRKTIILVTDGENTKSRFSTNSSKIDERTELACDAARALNINMFVIRLEEGNDALLEGCATIPPYYFDLKSSTQVGDALQSVLASMGEVRLVK